jgi:hypothetical protein
MYFFSLCASGWNISYKRAYIGAGFTVYCKSNNSSKDSLMLSKAITDTFVLSPQSGISTSR